ncbi:O-acetylhomoserine ami [Mycena alexandri]|uniref:O-acetylhomoserine ami n=1 Tax=Mycena alexandri TaxID=1745969 RepID=A0AAD6SF73_9AGAR|nr:O-acetylhomoserine ami [Mycena alexandri]
MAPHKVEHRPHFETLQLHAGQVPNKAGNGPRAVSIEASVAYMFQNSDHGSELFKGSPGNVYSRLTNGTVDVLEQRMAALEGGVAAVAASSGQAAQLMTLLGLCDSGHNIIAAQNGLFGGTYGQFKQLFKKFNITIKFVADVNPELFAKAIDENTRAIFVESISNPNLILAPIAQLSEIAHERGIPLVVDNTCGLGGWLIRPIDHGADIIVHSTTKWIGGHGVAMGGMIVDSGRFDWDASPKFKGVFNEKYDSRMTFALKMKWEMLRDMGGCQTAFNAFLTLTGLETLSLRAQRHCDNSLALAKWLEAHPKVTWVSYPGLKSHPDYARAVEVLHENAFGGIVCFGIAGHPRELVDNLKLASNVSHMGDAKTLIIHPSSTTNQSMSEEEVLASGVRRDLIRVSVGIENILDIIADFSQALQGVASQP